MLAAPSHGTRFRLSERVARELAETYGTPLYVLDEAVMQDRIREYRTAFAAAYPNSEIAFASKANSTLAVLAIAHREGCLIDVASEGELRAAQRAGVPPSRCHLHGNNKSRDELLYAMQVGIGQIVVDHFGEIDMIAELLAVNPDLTCPDLILRLAPGVDPKTHAKISTGQADTKFGFNIVDGAAEAATRRCLDRGLPLIGYHCHVGSQLLDPEAQRAGGELIARFAVAMKERHGFSARLLNVGGGLGASYTDADRPMAIAEYCRLIVEAVVEGLAGSGLTPKLAQEPGRSLIAEAGVTLYRVGVVKEVPSREVGTRVFVAVDGGLADNPRPALYNSVYTVERVAGEAGRRDDVLRTVTISGRHCETDKLFPDIEMPADLQPGDLVQVLVTGAYNSTMASNYNRYPRPATALIRADGRVQLVQRRETWDEMLAREILPEGL